MHDAFSLIQVTAGSWLGRAHFVLALTGSGQIGTAPLATRRRY